MKSAVTASLVPQAKGGPFILWDDLPGACATAARIGFDAIEIFPPDANAVAKETVAPLLARHSLDLAAVGTGGGWVAHKWHFTHADAGIRAKAREFALGVVHAAGALRAPAIVGSMQGKAEGEVTRGQAIDWLGQALEELAEAAASYGQQIFYEPLNRYETNIFNRVEDAAGFIQTLRARNVRILADMFHMNIEEVSIAGALKSGAGLIGHFHFADSNRRAIGWGHTDVAPVDAALREIGYDGYISGEALAIPDPVAAAVQTHKSYMHYFGS